MRKTDCDLNQVNDMTHAIGDLARIVGERKQLLVSLHTLLMYVVRVPPVRTCVQCLRYTDGAGGTAKQIIYAKTRRLRAA